MPVRQCTRATLADQIKGLCVTRQAKLLVHVGRKAGAEIACAGRDYDGVDVCGPKCRALQGEAAHSEQTRLALEHIVIGEQT